MNQAHFASLDLNLLRVFDALMEERNVTRAGARLRLTQSASSHALNRLRYMLEDDLFVRGGEGIAPSGEDRPACAPGAAPHAARAGAAGVRGAHHRPLLHRRGERLFLGVAPAR